MALGINWIVIFLVQKKVPSSDHDTYERVGLGYRDSREGIGVGRDAGRRLFDDAKKKMIKII